MRSDLRLLVIAALLVPAPALAEPPELEVVAGLEVGAGGVLRGGSPTYELGAGRGLVLGARRGSLSIEWHLLGRYGASLDGDLVASNTANDLSLSSFGVRVDVAPRISVYGGLARASLPLLVRDDDLTILPGQLGGMGPTAGVAVGWTLGKLRLGIELRLTQLLLTDAPPPQVIVTGPPDATGRVQVMDAAVDTNALLGTVGFTATFID